MLRTKNVAMRKLCCIALVLSSALLAETPPQLRSLVRESLEGLNRETKLRERYLYSGRNESIEFDAAGKTIRRRTMAWEMVDVEGVLLRRTIERDGQPLSEGEKAVEEESLKVQAREWKAAKPEERPRPPRAGHMEWLQEFPEALDYRAAGEELRGGRTLLIFEFQPRPGYKPRNMRARVFEKMRGKLWIDKTEKELARVEAEMFDDVNIGLGLFGRIARGTQFALSRRRLGERVWLVDWQRFRFDARILLVKSIRRQEINQFEGFRLRAVEAARLGAASE
jgi:hypothetical protein